MVKNRFQARFIDSHGIPLALGAWCVPNANASAGCDDGWWCYLRKIGSGIINLLAALNGWNVCRAEFR
ncbi:hypothetical protein BDW75DRAFT_7744 [Aspergillus navahoensis]